MKSCGGHSCAVLFFALIAGSALQGASLPLVKAGNGSPCDQGGQFNDYSVASTMAAASSTAADHLVEKDKNNDKIDAFMGKFYHLTNSMHAHFSGEEYIVSAITSDPSALDVEKATTVIQAITETVNNFMKRYEKILQDIHHHHWQVAEDDFKHVKRQPMAFLVDDARYIQYGVLDRFNYWLKKGRSGKERWRQLNGGTKWIYEHYKNILALSSKTLGDFQDKSWSHNRATLTRPAFVKMMDCASPVFRDGGSEAMWGVVYEYLYKHHPLHREIGDGGSGVSWCGYRDHFCARCVVDALRVVSAVKPARALHLSSINQISLDVDMTKEADSDAHSSLLRTENLALMEPTFLTKETTCKRCGDTMPTLFYTKFFEHCNGSNDEEENA